MKIDTKTVLSVLMAIFLSLPFLFYSPPETEDLFRHYWRYDGFAISRDFSYLLEYKGLSAIIYAFSEMGFPKESMAYFASFFIVVAMFTIYRNSFFKSNLTSAGLFFISIIILPYFILVSGIRFGLATSFFIFGLFYFINRSVRVKFLFCFFISLVLHSSYIIPVFILLLSRFSRFFIFNKMVYLPLFLIFSFLSFILPLMKENLFFIVESLRLNYFIGEHYKVYFFGEWGSDYFYILPFSGKAAYLLKKVTTYFVFFLFIYKYKFDLSKLIDRFCITFLLYLSLVSCFGQLSDRFEPIAIYFLFYLLVCKWKGNAKGTIVEWALIGLILLRALLDLWGYKVQYLALWTSML